LFRHFFNLLQKKRQDIKGLTVEITGEKRKKLPYTWDTIHVRYVVEGEVSGLRRPGSGHLYFSLKDDQAMLRAVAGMCSASGISCQVSLEAPMACGLGVCQGCVVPQAGGGYFRVCREGPVVEAAMVDWERL